MGAEENAVARQVTELLDRLGIPHHRIHCGRVPVRGGWLDLGEKDWPDHVAALDRGVSLYVETKTPIGKLTPGQKELHERLRARGHLVVVARRLEDVLEVISGVTV